MNQVIPTKQDCYYILAMLESTLIDFCYTQPWADKLIGGMEVSPSWLCDVATKKSTEDQKKAFREYLSSEPFELCPTDYHKFLIGCLWLRYERRELSWATYLQQVGQYLDSVGVTGWDCETPYSYLNQFEANYFTKKSEERTKKLYLKDHDVFPYAKRATEKLKPLMKARLPKRS